MTLVIRPGSGGEEGFKSLVAGLDSEILSLGGCNLLHLCNSTETVHLTEPADQWVPTRTNLGRLLQQIGAIAEHAAEHQFAVPRVPKLDAHALDLAHVRLGDSSVAA
jgi:hypothetical protein